MTNNSSLSKKVCDEQHDDGHRYYIDIEGVERPWTSPTITTEEIARLGGWDASAGIIEIDRENVERTLASGEVVELKPGHGYSKKVRWKRGDTLFDARLAEEHELLIGRYGEVQRDGAWFLIPNYAIPASGWNRTETAIALRAQPGFPGTPPYGIFVTSGIRFNGAIPQNYQEAIADRPPFEGDWGLFSWALADGDWRPGATAAAGSNLLNFAIGAVTRFHEGA